LQFIGVAPAIVPGRSIKIFYQFKNGNLVLSFGEFVVERGVLALCR